MTKEETDLVCNSGNDDGHVSTSVDFNFSRSFDHADFVADHLLDILTDNEHRKSSNYLEEEKKLREEEEKLYPSESKAIVLDPPTVDETSPSDSVDFESLKSLSDVGIDVSFLDSLQQQFEDSNKTPLDQLNDTAALIEELKEVQLQRLSALLPAHFSQLLHPTDHEMSLATQIQTNLVDMAGHVTPGDVVPQEVVRKVLGMSLDVEVSQPVAKEPENVSNEVTVE
jgi:hypothetical protein